ncbi:hypothetical protein HNQ93_001046 [Hymenobacter luteus]|uniref:YcxB family protein n=2 Tax=Hymenobacter TaxID=89966 RepID=A0A7W9SYF2_9BACT|nr:MULTISPECIES: hypothetical protein [Hymenobacter]MBB4599474.1 hypothetical protein [Hymenobacter latericoloratus]MBB6058216.1 hypothetical protein [Hymenobacter luteus]
MQLPNQRGGYRQQQQQQGASPLAIRTKKHQLDTDTYTKLAMGRVWRREWWYALIPFALGLLPALIWPSWWWLAAALLLTLLYVLFRSAQVTGVTQVEQTKPLFEKLGYEFDNKQIVLRRNEKEGMRLTWDMIGDVKREADGYLLSLRAPELPQELKGWRLWMAKTFDTPIFLQVPDRIFNSPNDQKLFDAMLRRKNLLPGGGPVAA